MTLIVVGSLSQSMSRFAMGTRGDMVDFGAVLPGQYAIGESAYKVFTGTGEQGVVFHEILHVTHPELTDGEIDCLVQYYGIENERSGNQNSLSYKPNCSNSQQFAAARRAGVSR